MKNLYEILEVSKKASKEVIEKAYHVLAKKYHPDLQPTQEKKKQAEEKMVEINEAYNILGNEQKRKVYDLKLEQELEEQKRKKEQSQLEELEKIRHTMKEHYTQGKKDTQRNTNNSYQNVQKIQSGVFDAYRQLYNNYWKNRKNKVKQPWTFKRFLELIKVLAIIAIIITVIWLLPPTHKLIMDYYEGNFIVKGIVDVIGKVIDGTVKGIGEFFKTIFNI